MDRVEPRRFAPGDPWAGGDAGKVRLALLMLLTLRGTPVLYQGDEIGLTDVDLTHEEILDPVGLRFWPHTRAGTRADADAVDRRATVASPRRGCPLAAMGSPDCNVADQRA